MDEFSKLAESAFHFLVTDYKFMVAKTKDDPMCFGNGFVLYLSTHMGIQVTLDRSDVFIKIGLVTDSIENWIEFYDVIKYYNPDEDVYIYPNEMNHAERVKFQLNRLVSLMKSYCSPILSGNFSKETIQEIKAERLYRYKRASEGK
jgi:hypothetical protein